MDLPHLRLTRAWPRVLAGLLLGICGLCSVSPVSALSVVFINPGHTTEAYWMACGRAMQLAAKSLGMSLEVKYAERNHLRALELAREVAARPKESRPDYAVFSNDYATGAELLRIFDGTGIKTFMAFSRLSKEEEASHGTARQKFKDWIGSLEPVALEAGYLTAQALIARGRVLKLYGSDGKLHVLALAGDRSTASSVLRNQGMQRAVAESADVVLEQTVYAAWMRDKAEEQTTWLLERHPQARLVWAGSDQMAFGAMKAAEARKFEPGRTMLFSGVNSSREALQAVRDGRLTALAGGHFMAGAWALVMIYDYHHGRDFADEGVQIERRMFALFDAYLAEQFAAQSVGEVASLDFRRYSKVLNPAVKRYEFGFAQLMREPHR